ncbi:hypothetical protein [Serratia silvae]|uniref:Terminase n=1 Tax=Serratia silvae TaxID=2824122 RepID=A0ABT0KH27_9GAMM|nr:hypothetical protein [Serratia silvae]MCL1031323.1 hypothetical protein [Serratia silvae]
MADNKRRLLQLNLDKVAVHSYYGKRFVDKHQKLDALASRQALLFNSISIGNMVIESGLDSAFKALDNSTFANANKAERAEMILRALELFCGVRPTSTSNSANALTPVPQEPERSEPDLTSAPPVKARKQPTQPDVAESVEGESTSVMAMPPKGSKRRTFTAKG